MLSDDQGWWRKWRQKTGRSGKMRWWVEVRVDEIKTVIGHVNRELREEVNTSSRRITIMCHQHSRSHLHTSENPRLSLNDKIHVFPNQHIHDQSFLAFSFTITKKWMLECLTRCLFGIYSKSAVLSNCEIYYQFLSENSLLKNFSDSTPTLFWTYINLCTCQNCKYISFMLVREVRHKFM